MKTKLDKGAKLPTRAHEADAGLDLYARETAIIYAKENHIFDTGVHIELPKNTAGFLKSRSGLYMNHGITSEGVVDEGYVGSIRVNLINHSDTPYVVNKGDKISQLVILPILKPTIEIVADLEDTERGENGFGSSGK